MAELIPAREVRAGDVMMDPNGNLEVRRVGHYGENAAYVQIWLRDDSGSVDPFTATWEFAGDELCRIVTRGGSVVGS